LAPIGRQLRVYCYELTKNYENIYFDTSALADEEVVVATGKEKIKYILETTIDDNPRKVLFGTDYSMCDISRHIELIESLNIKSEERDGIFYKNSIELFNLKISN